jgi:hypothetical protein
MFHPRTSRKKLEQVIRMLDTVARIGHTADGDGFRTTLIGEQRVTDRYDALTEALDRGLKTKKFDLSRDDARILVTALDLYNVRRIDGMAETWDDEGEQLFQELQALFAKAYGEALYPA